MSVDAIVIGAGLRGRFTYGGWAQAHPDQLRIVAIAEPDETRREGMAEEQELAPERVFSDWREVLEQPRMADAVIVATGDTLHVEPALAALERGYHLLLEKPMAPDPADCLRVVRAAERAQRILQVGHVLRHSAFYARVHEIVASGQLGAIATLDLKEHVAHWHMTHSYVRGKFRNRRIAAPILLAKSCHDLDLLVWLAGARPRRVSSFGSLSHFRSESAPQGAPERCIQGCRVQQDCIHDAVRFYLDPHDGIAQIWPWSDVSPDPSREARRRALETGPYGRCVYRTDNDALDHQVLAVELDGGIMASFTLQGLATHERRTLRISGSAGELRGVLQTGEIEITRHGTLDTERIQIEGSEIGHFGGDEGLIARFVDCVSREALDDSLTSGRIALESHLLGFAAERARETGSVVDLDAYCSELEAGIG
jgi:predicted dehydrogenase